MALSQQNYNGGYCKFCVLFATRGPNIEFGVLVNKPLTNCKQTIN